MTLTSLLDDESAQAHVLTFPKDHCWSSAMGFIQSKDGIKVFVKDRYDDESEIQVACSALGQEFAKAFQLPSVVEPCKSIERPSLESLKVGTAGHKLWQLKEETWKRESFASSEGEEKKDEVEEKPAPSEFDCWLLEESIGYYNKSSSLSHLRASDVDTSLRRKLRAAADRSLSGSIDFTTLLLLTEYTQENLATDPEWEDYKEYGLLENPSDALTREETHLLLNEKLKGVHFEVAVLFAIAFALPDVNIENVAIQEVVDDGKNWGLRLVHFDTEFLPTSSGVSLESLRCKLSSQAPPEFVGCSDWWGYYMPFLLSLPAADEPLQRSTLDGLRNVSVSRLQSIAEEQFSNSDVIGDDFEGLGEIIKTRIESMQLYASTHPNCTLKQIAFNTISAWKRDFPAYEEETWTAELIWETLEWVEGK